MFTLPILGALPTLTDASFRVPQIGETYKCFYSAELPHPPSCSEVAVVFSIPYRKLVRSFSSP